MAKKVEILKTVIVFLFFLFGCSYKYVDAKGKSLDEKVVDTWEELDCRVVEQDEQGFSLGLEVRDVIVVGDSIKAGEFYKSKSFVEKAPPWAFLGGLIGLGGCLGGIGYGLSNFSLNDYDEEKYNRACLISFTSCLAGAGVIFLGLPNRRKLAKAIPHVLPYFIKGDTVCTDSVFLAKEEIRIVVEKTDFEKIYYTDENGIIQLKFDDNIPKPTEADSILGIIVKYEEMADAVKVRRL